MLWVYLSPHFDDVALSCGGLIWEQVQAGDTVSIWTVCAGAPTAGDFSPFALELHSRWETGPKATAKRKQEDLRSCRHLGARRHYFNLLDCIYRRHPETGEFLYASEAALNGSLHPGDNKTISALQADLERSIKANMNVVCPLAIGNHVDHQLTRIALERMGYPAWYYPDYPYVEHHPARVKKMKQEGWVSRLFPVSRHGLFAWQDSIAAHGSQISTFWSNEDEMRQAVETYWGRQHAIRLWRMPEA